MITILINYFAIGVMFAFIWHIAIQRGYTYDDIIENDIVENQTGLDINEEFLISLVLVTVVIFWPLIILKTLKAIRFLIIGK